MYVYKTTRLILLKDHKILIKLRNWNHEGEAGDVEPEVYMLWITLFQSTLGFFTPTSAEDLFENLGKLVALPGRKHVTIENNEAKGLY